jgi:tRNA1Val (adenine37-N6)-methyltransferase
VFYIVNLLILNNFFLIVAMHNHFFRFKQFTINQENCAMKVGTDGVLLGAWTEPGDASVMLDVGTGTGLIAIMLAQRSKAVIHAIEIEPHASHQAMENVQKCPWKDRITATHSSFQDFSKDSNTKYDLIVTNPPFFSNSLKTPHGGRNLARHNDILPPDDLLAGVDRLLGPKGRFCLIMPYVDSSLFLVDAALYHLYCVRKAHVKATPGKKVTRVLMELGRERCKIQEEDIVIQESEGVYAAKFKTLTKDFYLFL